MASQAEGDTALYVAAKAGHDEAVRALLQVPVTKVNWQNHKGMRFRTTQGYQLRIPEH